MTLSLVNSSSSTHLFLKPKPVNVNSTDILNWMYISTYRLLQYIYKFVYLKPQVSHQNGN